MATDILCRFDAGAQTPVVFLADTINGNKIQAWKGEGKPTYVPLDYYHMTGPLSAADEKVLMERFKSATGKQDQVIRIRQRLPRTNRPLPNLLATGEATESRLPEVPRARKAAAKPIEQQAAPAAPQGNLPEAGEQLAAPVIETASTRLWREIQEANAHLSFLHQQMHSLAEQLNQATADYEATKVRYADLTTQYANTIELEAAEQLRKRKELLATIVQPLAEAPAAPTLPEAPVAHNTPPAAPTQAPAAKAPAKNGKANGKKK